MFFFKKKQEYIYDRALYKLRDVFIMRITLADSNV